MKKFQKRVLIGLLAVACGLQLNVLALPNPCSDPDDCPRVPHCTVIIIDGMRTCIR
jgi:hypothetical protein